MKYIFNNDTKIGEYPISEFQVCCYNSKGEYFDECWLNPNEIDPTHFIPECAVENESEGRRVFAHHKDGSIYELIFKKLTDEEIKERSIWL